MTPGMIFSVGKDAVRAVVWPPVTCGACRTQVAFVVNRDGTTLCLECDRLAVHLKAKTEFRAAWPEAAPVLDALEVTS